MCLRYVFFCGAIDRSGGAPGAIMMSTQLMRWGGELQRRRGPKWPIGPSRHLRLRATTQTGRTTHFRGQTHGSPHGDAPPLVSFDAVTITKRAAAGAHASCQDVCVARLLAATILITASRMADLDASRMHSHGRVGNGVPRRPCTSGPRGARPRQGSLSPSRRLPGHMLLTRAGNHMPGPRRTFAGGR